MTIRVGTSGWQYRDWRGRSFNNDPGAAAPRDADRLIEMLRRRGMTVSTAAEHSEPRG